MWGDEVLVEDPGYPGIRASLLGHGGAAYWPAPLMKAGCALRRAQRSGLPRRMAVVTPTHQFPTGVRMDLPRRQAPLQWAREHDAWVVEDDYDGDFNTAMPPSACRCSLPGRSGCCTWALQQNAAPGLRLALWWCRPRWSKPLPWPAPSPTGMRRDDAQAVLALHCRRPPAAPLAPRARAVCTASNG